MVRAFHDEGALSGTRCSAFPPRAKSPFAFTLIELLVVIGIIAVLIAILLPALNRARGQARTITCMSNMRQQGLGIAIYSAQNRGRLPYYWADNLGGTFQILVRQNLLSRGDKRQMVLGAPGVLPALNRTVQAPGVLQCPSAQDVITFNQAPRDVSVWARGRARNLNGILVLVDQGADSGAAGYGAASASDGLLVFTHYTTNGIVPASWNAVAKRYQFSKTIGSKTVYYVPGFANYATTGGNNTTETPMSMARIRSGFDTWMGFESGYWSQAGWNNMAFRHLNQSANFLYYDGHVETLRSGDVDVEQSGWGLNPPYSRVYDERLFINR